jgi:hypothetical protein
MIDRGDNRVIEMALVEFIKTHSSSSDTNVQHTVKRAQSVLKEMREPTDMLKMLHKGGNWLGVTREWIKSKFRNGETVTFGSQERLEGYTLCAQDVDLLASRIASATLNEYIWINTKEKGPRVLI